MKTNASKLDTKPQPRQRRSLWKVLSTQVAVSLLTLWVFRAQAVPMDYIFSGYTSGTFGGIPFNNARVTLNLYADTDNILDLEPGYGYKTLTLDGSSATVTVDGIGTGTFTATMRVFDTTFFNYPQFSAVGFSRGGPNGYDMWDFVNPVFNYYDLGPLGTIGGLHNNNGASIDEPTTFGDFINPAPTLVTSAYFTAVVIPEPCAGLLIGEGVVMAFIGMRVMGEQKPNRPTNQMQRTRR